MASVLPPFPKFPVSSDLNTVSTRWTKWISRFENVLVALDVDGEDTARRRALLLHYSGEEVQDIFDTLSDTGDADDYKTALEKLTAYFQPKKNTEYERYVFRQSDQKQGETLDVFHTRLRQLAVNCEFTDLNGEIKSQIIQKCISTRLRRRALRSPEMTLTDLLNLGRSMEISEHQAEEIEKPDTRSVNFVSSKSNYTKRRRPQQSKFTKNQDAKPKSANPADRNKKCRNCGGTFPHKHGPQACPAFGKQCDFCKRPNHYARCCLSNLSSHQSTTKPGSQHVHNVSSEKSTLRFQYDESSSDDEYVYTIAHSTSKAPKLDLLIENTRLQMLIDSGASVNLMDEEQFQKIKQNVDLQSTSAQVFPYASDKALKILGKIRVNLQTSTKTGLVKFLIVPGTGGSLLSYQTAVEFGLLKVIQSLRTDQQPKESTSSSVKTTVLDQPPKCTSSSGKTTLLDQPPKPVPKTSDSKLKSLLADYSDRFEGIGKMKNHQVKLHIDPDVPPVTQPHRRIPFHMRQKVEEELEQLEAMDIIERIDGPTPWVSPIVIAPKPKNPDQVRVCVDMRLPNKAIKRERHITPTVDDMVHDLNGATVFSKLDLNKAYHQLELAPESRYITTFTTHVGLRRYKRLNFGISSASEVFQVSIRQVLDGIPGTMNLSDDILVFGKTQSEHDASLERVMQRLREYNITLNRSKCLFNKRSLDFYGYKFSSEGMSPDPKKVEAIREMSPPTNASEVKSLLGMTGYCARFIPDYATITQPLRSLTQKNVNFEWSTEQEEAFEKLKRELKSETVMAYFDTQKTTELIVDASPVGLAGILTQRSEPDGDAKIVAYASRALSSVEQRYAQVEREGLGIVWACEHFNLYLDGASFFIVTDNKSMEIIFNNPKARPPARIERWALRLQKYDYTVIHRSGKENPADFLSRHPSNLNHSQRHQKCAEEYVTFLSENRLPTAMTLDEVRTETSNDQVLTKVMECVQSGNWSTQLKPADREMKAYHKVHDELTVNSENNVILKGSKIVLPKSLHQKAVKLAHEGHQGMVKTKSLLREVVWFPGIDKLVEEEINQCLACQIVTDSKTCTPLQMSELPNAPWQHVSVDFCGPLPSSDYLLVMIDEYSRFPVVEIIKSTSANTVIPVIDKVFSEFGIPQVLKSDNGPPFNGHEFQRFSTYLGFHHRKITPYWPKANAEAERFMQNLEKSMRTAQVENLNWKQELNRYLRNYRATPHATVGVTPAELLMGRKLHVRLPNLFTPTVNDHTIRKTDARAKAKMKKYSDMRNRAKSIHLTIGDTVLVKQPKRNKLSTPFCPDPYTVTRINGTMATAENAKHVITRNISHFKQISCRPLSAREEKTWKTTMISVLMSKSLPVCSDILLINAVLVDV